MIDVPRVKICCIASPSEAALAVAHGAAAVGLVSAMPSGPGMIDEDEIARIAGSVAGADTVLLTSHTSAADIIAQHRRCGTDVIQLCDAVRPDELRRVRDARPDARLMQVVHVEGAASIEAAIAIADDVDAILLDSGRPRAALRELGGTGRTHDWSVSRAIRDALPIPLFLAGGLRADNVVEAIETVRPHGIDVCTGVRIAGRLDPVRLDAFMAAVRATATAVQAG